LPTGPSLTGKQMAPNLRLKFTSKSPVSVSVICLFCVYIPNSASRDLIDSAPTLTNQCWLYNQLAPVGELLVRLVEGGPWQAVLIENDNSGLDDNPLAWVPNPVTGSLILVADEETYPRPDIKVSSISPAAGRQCMAPQTRASGPGQASRHSEPQMGYVHLTPSWASCCVRRSLC